MAWSAHTGVGGGGWEQEVQSCLHCGLLLLYLPLEIPVPPLLSFPTIHKTKALH